MDSTTTNSYLIVIAIVGLIISVVLSIFFSFLPIARMEQKFNDTADVVDEATARVILIAQQVEISAIQTVDTLNRLNRFEQAVCTDHPGLLPSFCR